MAVISRRLGQVISTKPQTNTFDPTEGSAVPTTQTTSGGSSVPSSYYDALARAAEQNAATNVFKARTDAEVDLGKLQFDAAKFAQEQALAAQALARQQAGAAEQLKYLQGQLGAGIPSTITGELEAQQRTGEEYIQNQAAALLKQLQDREAASRGLTQTGFSNLMNYLARNQPTAFAQAQRAMPAVTESQLGQYMAGQGVSPAAAQEAARLANIQAAGGASNYNQLLNVLAAREAAGQQSRQAEAEMGLATQLANLQGLYGAATGGLEQSRLSALADLASRISAARLQAQREAAARDQAIQDAIAALLATGLIPSQGTGTGTGTGTGAGTGAGAGGGMTPDTALAALNQLAPTNPNAPVDMMLRNIPPADEVAALIALAQQSPQYTGGGAGFGGLGGSNLAVMI